MPGNCPWPATAPDRLFACTDVPFPSPGAAHKLKARQQQLDPSIARYLADLDPADRDPSHVP